MSKPEEIENDPILEELGNEVQRPTPPEAASATESAEFDEPAETAENTDAPPGDDAGGAGGSADPDPEPPIGALETWRNILKSVDILASWLLKKKAGQAVKAKFSANEHKVLIRLSQNPSLIEKATAEEQAILERIAYWDAKLQNFNKNIALTPEELEAIANPLARTMAKYNVTVGPEVELGSALLAVAAIRYEMMVEFTTGG